MIDRPDTERILRLGWSDLALWGTASLLVIGLCLGSALALDRMDVRSEPQGMPEPAIFLDFAEAPASPTTEELDLPSGDPSPQSEAAPQPEAEPEADTEPVSEPPPASRPEPAEQPETVPEPNIEPDPVPEQMVEDAVEAAATEPAIAMPVPMPPEIARLRETGPATDVAPRRPPSPPSAASQAAAPPPAPKAAPSPAAPPMGAGARPEASDIRNWQAQVMRHLAQRRQYPPGASQRREQGVAAVRFSIGPGGEVLSAALAQSSGFAELDQAAIALVHRSSPLPPPPAGLPPTLMTLTAPIEYSLRR